MARIADDPQGATALGYDVGLSRWSSAALTIVSSAALADRRARAQASFRTPFKRYRAALCRTPIFWYDVSYFLRQDAQRRSISVQRSCWISLAVSQLNGSYITVRVFWLTTIRSRLRTTRKAICDRLRAFAGVLAGETERLQSEAERGYAPPGFILDMVTSQLQALRAKTSYVSCSRSRVEGAAWAAALLIISPIRRSRSGERRSFRLSIVEEALIGADLRAEWVAHANARARALSSVDALVFGACLTAKHIMLKR